MTDAATYSRNQIRALVDACRDDFGRFAYDGFGIMLTDEQLDARRRLGAPGPRLRGEYKNNWLSGGQRAGKTVEAFLYHAEACLYKIGVDPTQRSYWRNYQYRTLAIAPTNELTLRLYTIGDEVSKGVNDAQYDRRARRARGGAFLGKVIAGKQTIGGVTWPAFLFSTGSETNFRSSEGFAYRLEGGQWWWITWDEWASQPEREIHAVLTDVLFGRSRDHDAKILPMAWPKAETESHLIKVIREIESGQDRDSQVIYLSADAAYFTNRRALAVERRTKSPAQWKRTVLGEPAGGAAVEFKPWMTENMVKPELSWPVLREDGYVYFNSWDLGLAHDATDGFTFRIPLIGGRPQVTVSYKARIVNWIEHAGGDSLTPDTITFSIATLQQLYRAESAIDASEMGGVAAVRQLADLHPPPYAFASRSNDRLHGNMRLAAITNGLDMLSWGRVEEDPSVPFGLVESPKIQPLLDQLASFDRDAKNQADDRVWAFLIGLWYIRRFYVQGQPPHQVPFDVRAQPKRTIVTPDVLSKPAPPRAGVVLIRRPGDLLERQGL